MIRVRKISHATYEIPDIDRQVEYYTEILGLTVTDREKDAVYLANTLDHHAVVLHKGEQARCVRLGFQLGRDDDLDAFEKQTQAHGIKTTRKKDPEPSVTDQVSFEDPKGTVVEVFKSGEFAKQKFQTKTHGGQGCVELVRQGCDQVGARAVLIAQVSDILQDEDCAERPAHFL